jgi:predicted PurR-regulated permease PerM
MAHCAAKWFLARRILLQMSTVFPLRFAWYLLAAAAGSLLYLVAPILTPFLLSAVLDSGLYKSR